MKGRGKLRNFQTSHTTQDNTVVLRDILHMFHFEHDN